SFTRAGAGAGAAFVGVAAPSGGVVASVVLEVPPEVEGAVGVGLPTSTGAAVSGLVAPLSERGIGSLAGGAPEPTGSSVRPLLGPEAVFGAGLFMSAAFACWTSFTGFVSGGSIICGSPTLAVSDVSG